MHNVLTSLYLGLDSLVVCIGLGALNRPRWTWPLLALGFGIADAVGTIMGGVFGPIHAGLPSGSSLAAPVAMVGYGCLVAAATTRAQALAATRVGLVLLPILLSLDNFVAAALGDDGAAPSAPSTFLATSVMALLGCMAGAALARRWPALGRLQPGGAIVAAGLIMSLS